jgi:hypothetical protein
MPLRAHQKKKAAGWGKPAAFGAWIGLDPFDWIEASEAGRKR